MKTVIELVQLNAVKDGVTEGQQAAGVKPHGMQTIWWLQQP